MILSLAFKRMGTPFRRHHENKYKTLDMKKIHPVFFIIVLVVLFVFGADDVSADAAPPLADIEVAYDQQKVPDAMFYVGILTCDSGEAANSDPYKYTQGPIPQLEIREYNPSRSCFWHPRSIRSCANSACGFLDFPYGGEVKFAFYLPSSAKTFISEPLSAEFGDPPYYKSYQADLSPDGSMKMVETSPNTTHRFFRPTNPQITEPSDHGPTFQAQFIVALLLTVLLELLTSFGFAFVTKIPKKILLFVVIANLISVPLVWFVFPRLPLPILWILLSAEIFTVLFETSFISVLARRKITLRQSFALSLVNNLVSFFVGGYLLLLIFSLYK